MKKSYYTIYFLIGLSIVTTILLGCQHKLSTVPSANIASVLSILNDDTSGIAWPNKTHISLGSNPSFKGSGVKIDGTKITITKGGDYILTGTLSNGYVIVDTTDLVNLTLDNANITNLSGPAITITNANTAYITLLSDTKNYLSTHPDASSATVTDVLQCSAPLTFQGNGSLDINGKSTNGITCNNELTINNGFFTISTSSTAISTNNSLIVNGGHITINKTTFGITAMKNVVLNGGGIDISDVSNALLAKGDLSIQGSTVNITNCHSGLVAYNASMDTGNLNVETSNTSMTVQDTITVNDGYLHLKSEHTAMYAKKAITINNGTTLAFTRDDKAPSINCPYDFKLNGGILLATGLLPSHIDCDTNTQHSLLLNNISTDTLIHIQEGNQDILTFIPDEDCTCLLFSSPLIKANKAYTLYTGGKVSSGTSFYGLYTNATYSKGTKTRTLTYNNLAPSIKTNLSSHINTAPRPLAR